MQRNSDNDYLAFFRVSGPLKESSTVRATGKSSAVRTPRLHIDPIKVAIGDHITTPGVERIEEDEAVQTNELNASEKSPTPHEVLSSLDTQPIASFDKVPQRIV